MEVTILGKGTLVEVTALRRVSSGGAPIYVTLGSELAAVSNAVGVDPFLNTTPCWQRKDKGFRSVEQLIANP